ncbi:PIG-L family deacetylase [Streptomyces sp. NPDC048659]|uniref:PIG-L deacetylase family protein n=1 Tax=Streptomyces sp. NPDC048659 TaxID=3155489 RepID=UPI003428C455
MKTVLIVVAHPDDAEIAMGMRIHEYARHGVRVWVHCLTVGTPGSDGTEERRDECLAAGAILGVENYTFSRIPDTRFVENRGEMNGDLLKVFHEARPDIVYTHFPEDQHLDHRVTGQEVTTVALRAARDLCYFRSPYSLGFEPTKIFMGTRELLNVKMEALSCFPSQRQLDMSIFRKLAEIAHRQHVHHRIVESFPSGLDCAELFRTAREIECAEQAEL